LTGQTVRALFENTQQNSVRPYLEQHNLLDADANKWYPLQAVLDILSDLSEQGDAMFNFVAIGMAAADLSPLTPQAKAMALEQFLLAYPTIYQQRHRDGDPGRVQAEKVADNHIVMRLETPYPDDIMYGLLYGFARRFMPAGKMVRVTYDDDAPRREQGGPATILHVVWDS